MIRDDENDNSSQSWLYGPFHRIQSADLNEEMQNSGRIGGKAPRNVYASAIPKVKAYVGHLPSGKSGIEFFTNIEPDRGTPPNRANWSQGRDGVIDVGPDPNDGQDIVAIPARIIKRVDHA